MRSLLISGFLLLVMSATSFASIHVGARGGINLSTLSDKWDFEESGKHIKPGLLIGGLAEVPLLADRFVTVRAELLYVQKGWKTNQDARGNDGNYTGDAISFRHTFHEAALAALLGVRLPTKGFAPYALIGPEIEYEFTERSGWVSSGEGESSDVSSPPYFNLSINLGLGGAIPLSGGELQTELRLNQGLLSRLDKDAPWSYRTSCLQLTLAYLLPLSL